MHRRIATALMLLILSASVARAQKLDDESRALRCIEEYYAAIEAEDLEGLASLFHVSDRDESAALVWQHEIMFRTMDFRLEELHFLDCRALGPDRLECNVALRASISRSGENDYLPKREENLFLLHRVESRWKILSVQRKLVLDLLNSLPDAHQEPSDQLSTDTSQSMREMQQAEAEMMRLLEQADIQSTGSMAAARRSMLEDRRALDEAPGPDARERYHQSRERLIELLEASPETYSPALRRSHERYLEAREAYRGRLRREANDDAHAALLQAEKQYRDALQDWLDLVESANASDEELEAARLQYEQAREELMRRRSDAPPESAGLRWF